MRENRAGRTPPDRVAVAIAAGLATWWCAIALGNLPTRALDRVRGADRMGALMPNWRLFAPSPVARDFRLVYRCSVDGTLDPEWRTALSPTLRQWHHMVWHPEGRREKGLFDLAIELSRRARTVPPDQVHTLSSFHVLERVVRERARARRGADLRVQFALLRHDGYAEGVPSLAFLSDLLPVRGVVDGRS